jgi:DNA-binding transcriptional MerR regulator
MKRHYLLRDVAAILKVKPYQIAYALSVGLVPEPALRIANKRVFQQEDLERLATHFNVSLKKKYPAGTT